MCRILLSTASIAFFTVGVAVPAAALQSSTDFGPESRASSTEPRPEESKAIGEFFMQSRAQVGAALPDSEVRGPVESIGIDRGRLHYQLSGESTWVRGRTYKAQITTAGFTYIPFLGSEAPRNFPVSFRLVSAALGGHEIELWDRGTVRRTGDRVILDRGAVDVIYDFAVENVEQSFALDVAGATSDLTLELQVSTELCAAAVGDGFSVGNDLGGMRYSAATVFDGAGRSARVPVDFSGSHLTLTVPASFLSAATGPIVVDPLISTFFVDTASGYQRDVEIAYQVGSDRFLYVYEDQFSGTDVDIYATDLLSNGTDPRGAYMDFGTEDWCDPSAATVTFAGKGLVAACSTVGSSASIVARTWDFGSGSFDAGIIQLTAPTTSPYPYGPDVGGSSAGSPGARFVVVWNMNFGPDTDAQGRVVMPDGTLGSALFLDTSLDRDSTDICISESTGDPSSVNRWNVAWANQNLVTNAYTIRGTQLDAAGAVAFSPVTLLDHTSTSFSNELDVSDAIAFPGSPLPVYALSYRDAAFNEEDLFVLFLTGGALINSVDLQRSEHADMSPEQREARISSNGQEFVVSYLEPSTTSAQHNGFLTSFDFTEGRFLSISERRVPFGSVGATDAAFGFTPGGGLALASRHSGGLSTSRAIGVGHDVGTGSDADVRGHVYLPSNGYSPAFQYCYGNPNSTGERGFIRLSGDRSTTGPKQMIATALPPNSFGYFVVGTDFANTVNPGGSAGVLCVGGSIGRYSNAVTSSGSTGSISVTFDPQQISQPNGAVPGMSGQFWQFALWHRDTAGGSATSNFTNAVSLLFE